MQVNRCTELFGTFQDRPEELVVEIAAAVVAVDNSTGEFLPTYAAVERLCGLFRDCGRQRRKAAEARRMPLDRVRDKVVRFDGKRDRFGRIQLFYAGRCQGHDLHVDAGGVHFRYALVTEVAKLRDELERSSVVEFLRLLLQVPSGAFEKSRRCKMLFERDGPHGR